MDHIEGFSIYDHVLLCEGDNKVLLLLCSWNQIAKSFGNQLQSGFLCRCVPCLPVVHDAPPFFEADNLISNFFAKTDNLMPSESQTAFISTKSSRRSPVSYLLTKLCGTPKVSDSS